MTENTAGRADPRTAPIDILICTYKRPEKLAMALVSLRNMTDAGPFRVIIVDDDPEGSGAEPTRGAVESGLEVLYFQSGAGNVSAARNLCLSSADEEWLAFFDDDQVASPTWLLALREAAVNYDIVFGPVKAIYPPDAPSWAIRQDHHSSNLKDYLRSGQVVTGHSCNTLMWRGREAPWAKLLFNVELGTCGGEDTEFFAAARTAGARLGCASDAVVSEAVDPERLQPVWMELRKRRSGWSYARSLVAGRTGVIDIVTIRARAGVLAFAKTTFCRLRTVISSNAEERMFWRLRAMLHEGALRGALGLPVTGLLMWGAS